MEFGAPTPRMVIFSRGNKVNNVIYVLNSFIRHARSRELSCGSYCDLDCQLTIVVVVVGYVPFTWILFDRWPVCQKGISTSSEISDLCIGQHMDISICHANMRCWLRGGQQNVSLSASNQYFVPFNPGRRTRCL